MSCPTNETIVHHFLKLDRDNPIIRRLNSKHIRSCKTCWVKHSALEMAFEMEFGKRPRRKRERINPELN